MVSGDVRINQDGEVPTAHTLPNAVALDIALVDAQGDQVTGFDPSRPSAATLTAVTYAVGSVSVLAANVARRGVLLFNATNKPVNIALGATASASVFSFQLPTGGSYEGPLAGYTGAISAFWPAAPGAGPTLHVTEILP